MRKKSNNLIFPLLVMGVLLIFASSCKQDDVNDNVNDDVPKIGSSYAGGLVFYIDSAGHGLVCAESDQSTGAEWGCSGTIIDGTSTAMFTGEANTNAIVAGCTQTGIAARNCYNLTLNGYSDWYLPSSDELSLMFTNLHTQGLGNFQETYYWSSSAGFELTAWTVSFSTGYTYYCNKNVTQRVRAVRTF